MTFEYSKSPLSTSESYEFCKKLTKREAKNFYYAFLTLPYHQRLAAFSGYAFCRICDDAVDEPGTNDEKNREIIMLHEQLENAKKGIFENPVFQALEDTTKNFAVPWEYFETILEGMSMDIHISRYSNFDELKRYCYNVASIVGLICIEVFGYKDPKAKIHAIDLGLGMQLTNIIRDISEDAKMGRIYIPLDEIKDFEYSEKELLSGVYNEKFILLMEYQLQRARMYLNSGKLLLQHLPKRSRACPLILLEFYNAILDRIEKQNYNVFNNRISLSTLEKGFLAIRLWIRSFLPIKKDPIV